MVKATGIDPQNEATATDTSTLAKPPATGPRTGAAVDTVRTDGAMRNMSVPKAHRGIVAGRATATTHLDGPTATDMPRTSSPESTTMNYPMEGTEATAPITTPAASTTTSG